MSLFRLHTRFVIWLDACFKFCWFCSLRTLSPLCVLDGSPVPIFYCSYSMICLFDFISYNLFNFFLNSKSYLNLKELTILLFWVKDAYSYRSNFFFKNTSFIQLVRTVYLWLVWASQVVQMVKNLPAMQETWVQSLSWDGPLEEGMATHSSILAWRIPMDKEVWQCKVHEVTKSQHNWATKHRTAWLM